MLAGHLGERLCLAKQPSLTRGLGPAICRAEHGVEHLDREVGERSLALDHEGDEGSKPPLDREAYELARMDNLRLARDDAVAVGVDDLAVII